MRAQLQDLLQAGLSELANIEAWPAISEADLQLERTRDARHGDFTTNIAMRVAKSLGISPREFAAKLVAAMPNSELLESIDIAGPGFINIGMSLSAYHRELLSLLESKDLYGSSTSGAGKRVLVEYVSANPTGPLHVGHGRHAAFGASLANLLRATGHEVDEEYYVNDAGRQMDILAVSVWLRYLELCGQQMAFPENCYQGGYCRDIAAEIFDHSGSALVGDPAALSLETEAGGDEPEQRLDTLISTAKQQLGDRGFRVFLDAAIQSILRDIKDDLAEFGVTPPRWYSERSLVDSGAIDAALAELERSNLLYVADGAIWFRTTDFGDDKDRVVVRENGAKTYFASDIAYHREKCERGYDLLLNVLGSDHHGYVPRVKAALEGLGKPADRLEVQLVQFVVLYRGNDKVQMTTRGGTYVTLRELRNEVGNDAARFFYVSRSNDQHLDFDLELAKTQSNDNPVYYVQYAHARIARMLEKLRDEGMSLPTPVKGIAAPLTAEEEKSLMVRLSRYPEIVQLAAANRAPQTVVHYIRELAAEFHSYYNAHRILVEDDALRNARTLLALGTQQVLRNALRLLGVSAPEQM